MIFRMDRLEEIETRGRLSFMSRMHLSCLFFLALAPATCLAASASGTINVAEDSQAAHKPDNMAGMFAPVSVGDLTITAAAIKAMTPGQPVGGGFLTIANKGGADDRLVSVSVSTGAKRVELHEMSMDNDIMTMRKLADGLPLPAGQIVEMKPGGLHMMLMGVAAPYKAGDMVRATLTFEKAGTVEIDIPVVDMQPGVKAMKM
jgi:copper(I)-binding protein